MISQTVTPANKNSLCSFFLHKSPTIQRNVHYYGFPKFHKNGKNSMVLATKPLLEDGILRINGRETLTQVPKNVQVSPAPKESIFLGAISDHVDSTHVFKLGILQNHRLLSLFRFKIWWMTPKMGISASDVPKETQMLLLESKEEEKTSYIVLLPVLDGLFRSSLQGNSLNELEFCIESGDPAVKASNFSEAIHVNYGDNPFDLMKESMQLLEELKGTFSPREKKKMPGMLDWFGWCTWDAFYFDVNPKGIEEGLKSLSEGGTPARYLIIDDGWQDVDNEFQTEGVPIIEGSQWGGRLASIKENSKFNNINGQKNGMKHFITSIKRSFGLKYIYVWHALMGYWGGVHPNAPETKKYNSKLLYPKQSKGNLAHSRDGAMDSMEKYGVAMINPESAFEFYDDLHSYLVSQKVDGVKVDVQNILETLATGYNGRVSLTHKFQQALEKSVSKNFRDNSIICCMGQSTDSVYSSKVSAITRASDDYMPKNQTSQTLHVATVAFNSIFLGEFVVPDWDMFYSKHYAAEFHAAARALGGCGVYVSDKPEEHDFTLLKKLVLPDGSILRAKYPGRPTRDCLFNDPVIDGKSLLKIWNVNELTGVIGVFNCQGAGAWYGINDESYTSCQTEITGTLSPCDVEHLNEVVGEDWTSDCAVYAFNADSLHRLHKNGRLTVALKTLETEVFTISPIKSYNESMEFEPIGLVNMYNSGGSVKAVNYSGSDKSQLSITGKGPGLFGAYSSKKPVNCTVNWKEVEFEYKSKDNFLMLTIPVG